MVFSREEILDEIGEATGLGQEWFEAGAYSLSRFRISDYDRELVNASSRLAYHRAMQDPAKRAALRAKQRERYHAIVKSDPEKLERKRASARSSSRRAYRRAMQDSVKRAELWAKQRERYHLVVKRDPEKLERRRASARNSQRKRRASQEKQRE